MAQHSGRNGTIDILRFFAAAGIVMFHTKGPWPQLGYGALPLFVLLAGYFSYGRGGPGRSTWRRALRLLLIWGAWSLIYGGLKLAQAAITREPPLAEFSGWMLLTGPSLHLWFLPFAVALLLLGSFLPRLASRIGAVPVVLGLAFTAGLALGLEQRSQLPVPLAQWVHAWPGAALGFLLAQLQRQTGPAGVLLTSLALCAALSAITGLFDWKSGGLQLLGAVVLANAAFVLRWRETAVSRALREISLGLYLVHPAVIAVLLAAHFPGYGQPVFYGVTLAISTLAALALRSPRLRFLLGF